MLSVTLLLSIAKTAMTIITILVSLFIIKFVLTPLKRMFELKRSDASFYFFPGIGFNRYMRNDLKTKGDFLHSIKHYKENHPNKKFEVTNLGSSVTIMLRDPDLIKEFVNKPALYEKHHVFRVIKMLTGTGLPMAEGDTWKIHRKIVSSCFHYEFLTSNTNNIMNIINEFLDKITPQDYQNYPITLKMQEITGDVIGRMFFGERLSNYTFKGKSMTLALAQLGTELGLCAVSLGVLLFGTKILKAPFIPRYRKVMQDVTDFRKLCLQIVQDRKSTNPQKSQDLLGTLLQTQQSGISEQCLSDEDIVNEFISFYLAGVDTTGHLVSMALYNLTQYPEYLQILQEERDQTFNTETIKTAETLQKMDSLHAFIKETLRFYSPAPGVTFRVATADHKLLDLEIKKGDVVRADLFSAYYNQKYFDHPHEFNPKRFCDNKQKVDSYVFIPFSAGPRNCIGQHLAVLEAKLLISEFLERFDFKLQDGYKLKMINRFTYEPVDHLLFNLTPRSV